MARTAVIAGTASAVNGRVQRRQAERFADRDAQIYAQREQAYQQQQPTYQQPQQQAAPQPAPSATGGSTSSVIEQLQQLAALKDQGILTDEEFAQQKARILGT